MPPAGSIAASSSAALDASLLRPEQPHDGRAQLRSAYSFGVAARAISVGAMCRNEVKKQHDYKFTLCLALFSKRQ